MTNVKIVHYFYMLADIFVLHFNVDFPEIKLQNIFFFFKYELHPIVVPHCMITAKRVESWPYAKG